MMKKFKITVTRNTYVMGSYEIEAPDKDAAYILAEDIPLNDDRIVWDEIYADYHGFPRPTDIDIEEIGGDANELA